MALLLKRAFKGYIWAMEDLRDPRADDFPLMSSPLPIFILGILYLFFVNKWGPEYMKNREPFQLDRIIMIYNIFQVLINAYIVIEATKHLSGSKLNFHCTPIDFSDDPVARKFLKLTYAYFIIKIIDLLDTVFFILRKKNNQVTFLHVYHHYGMANLGWGGVKYLGGGHSIFLGYINSIVHTIMYFYYFLTSWDPAYKKSVWWKKYITQLQLLQFLVLLLIYGSLLFKPDCTYPRFASYFFVPQNIFMLFLFGDFYRKTYLKPKSAQANKIKEEKDS